MRLKRASQGDGVDSSLVDGGLGRLRNTLRLFAEGREHEDQPAGPSVSQIPMALGICVTRY